MISCTATVDDTEEPSGATGHTISIVTITWRFFGLPIYSTIKVIS